MQATGPSRRDFLRALSAAALGGVVATATSPARALGRPPFGGALRVELPWPVAGVDPHELDDPGAALFAPAVINSLYALDAKGRPFPVLADALPTPTTAGATTIRLREGLVTARGAPLSVDDVVWSLRRAQARGAAGWLLGMRWRRGAEPGTLEATGGEPELVATRLASVIAAIVPRDFSPHDLGATGAFSLRADGSGTAATLTRNARAARGPAFLDAIKVSRADSLEAGIRAFEVGDSDIAWLGTHLYRPRPGAQRFDAGSAGWVVLRTGKESGALPGVAQALLDALDPATLAPFWLGPLPRAQGTAGWYGKPTQLLVRSDAPYLTQLADVLAELLTRPGHEVRARAVPVAELRQRRRSGRYPLMLDLVRRIGPPGWATALALLTAVEPVFAMKPPLLREPDPRRVLRNQPMGIVGELRLAGSYAPAIHDLATWTLGNTWRA